MPATSSGKRTREVELQNPFGEPVSSGDGEYTQEYRTFVSCFARILPATAENVERYAQATVVATATHLVIVPYMTGMGTEEGINSRTRVKYGTRLLFVRGYSDPEERHIEIVLACQEILL